MNPRLPTLEAFDSVVLQRIRLVQRRPFATCQGFPDGLSLRDEAVEVLMAVAILSYKDMLQSAPASSFLKSAEETPTETPASTSNDQDLVRGQTALLAQQSHLISTLTTQVKALSDRIVRLENPASTGALTEAGAQASTSPSEGKHGPQSGARSRPKSLSSVWYECSSEPKATTSLGRTTKPKRESCARDAKRKAISANSWLQRLQQEGKVLDTSPPKSVLLLPPCYSHTAS